MYIPNRFMSLRVVWALRLPALKRTNAMRYRALVVVPRVYPGCITLKLLHPKLRPKNSLEHHSLELEETEVMIGSGTVEEMPMLSGSERSRKLLRNKVEKTSESPFSPIYYKI